MSILHFILFCLEQGFYKPNLKSGKYTFFFTIYPQRPVHSAPRQLADHDEADHLQRAVQRTQHKQHEHAGRHVSGH